MKRFMAWVVLALAFAVAGAPPTQADVNDFVINSFEADYYLGRDDAGRSTLKTVERIVAEFPQHDQNHGIERAIPAVYDGHPTGLKIVSVKGDGNRDLPYSTRRDDAGNEVLRIGDGDAYVHGRTTYVITYEQRDITRFFANTDSDEFYWDVNGTLWRQNFGQVTARVHIGDELRLKFTNNISCYYGSEGVTTQCRPLDQDGVVSATVQNLQPGQNMTLAIGFAKGTFAAYEPTLAEKIWDAVGRIWVALLVATAIIGFMLIFVMSFRYSSLSNRKKDIKTVVPEYLPPKNTSVLLASHIGDGTRAALTAQIVDLAVRHYVKIYQTKEKSLFKSAEYDIEIIKPINDLSSEERSFLSTLFGSRGTAVGARLDMKSLKSDYSVASKMQKNTKALDKLIKGKYNLRKEDPRASSWFKKAGIWMVAISALTVSPPLLIAAIIAFVCGSQLRPLTDKGLDLRRYLMGLKMYIGVAEKERLQMLQSPEGAEKVEEGTVNDPKKLVKLYERVLPYAILFGQEQAWNKQMGVYYEQNGTGPDWYSGNAAFSAVAFSSAMNDFSSTTNSYAASSSSSSGGSSGGGSSGGGGGGGGGGGW